MLGRKLSEKLLKFGFDSVEDDRCRDSVVLQCGFFCAIAFGVWMTKCPNNICVGCVTSFLGWWEPNQSGGAQAQPLRKTSMRAAQSTWRSRLRLTLP